MPNESKKRKIRFPEWTPEWVKLCFRIGYWLSILFLVASILVAIFYWILASQYNMDEITKKSESYLTYYHDGQEIASARSQLDIITYDDLPEHTVQALLAREDTKFFHHCGIDLKGLARATLKNITTLSYKEGASTISMQLVKNTYDNKSKSIHRKLLEIALTLRMESHYEKEDIFCHYLNRIYFGAGRHGIRDAAQAYFGITPSELTLGQSALLMGIIRGPHIFSPFNPNNGLANSIEQRDQVLKRMLSLEFITQEELEEAKKAPLNLLSKEYRNDKNTFANYSVRSIERHRKQVIDSQKIIDSGLHIHSTIDKKVLNQITLDLKQVLPPDDSDNPLQVASVLLHNETGAVRAIIGGRNFITSPYNRALDSKLQLGSAFYPFLYLAAFEHNHLPVANQPIVTGNQIGYETMLKFAKRYGITNRPAKLQDDLYRGQIHASPLQLATAYSIFKTEGNRVESYFIESIKNKDNKELFTHIHHNTPVARAANANSAFEIFSKKQDTTVFTGYSYKHAWIIAISDDYTAVTWLGHDKPKDIPNKKQTCAKLEKLMKKWVSN